MSLLEDITSKDPQRIWASACAIRTLRDPQTLALLVAHLDEIKQSTNGVPLGGALRPNASHLAFAIRKLEFVKNQSGCLCSLYTLDDLYDPAKEEQAGNIRILASTSDKETWSSVYECQCCLCQARYHVEQGEYHYTWWAWTRCN